MWLSHPEAGCTTQATKQVTNWKVALTQTVWLSGSREKAPSSGSDADESIRQTQTGGVCAALST